MKPGFAAVSLLASAGWAVVAAGAPPPVVESRQAEAQEGLRAEREAEQQAREEERRDREREREDARREREAEKLEQAEDRYDEGTEALDENQWDQAVQAFDQVCRLGGRRCDGALYWKAYALHKRGRKAEAQAAIAELRKAHATSRWISEAKALELEIQQAAGRPPSPEQEDDEELKLLALDSLMDSNAERALPLLEEFLKSGNSPRLKDRALFVLSQSDAPRARDVLLGIARGATNPDLQLKAVRYLGMSGDAGSLKALEEVYAATAEVPVKRAILQAYVMADDRARVFAAARSEKSVELRREAVHSLGALEGVAELQQLYGSETAPEIRETILNAFVAADAERALLEVAQGEKDARLRAAAVRNLGALDSDATGAGLVALYGSETDVKVRRAVLDAFVAQDNCAALVKLGRAEKEPVMRRAIVKHLSALECKEATDFLLEILKK
jgi:hypothetical protein